jgi:5-methyltetrahydropteroyltriglutamate--homocysteine methyltransferase
MKTYAYGYPRLGRNREFKRTVESFWNKRISETQLNQNIHALDQERIETYQRFVDQFPIGEMSLYDSMLDTAIMLGLYPQGRTISGYFELARGTQALELTKWFNNNYHYLVPELSYHSGGEAQRFSLIKSVRPFFDFQRHASQTPYIPYVIGPYTFLRLSKGYLPEDFNRILSRLVPVYQELFTELKALGATLIHVDEPAWGAEVSAEYIKVIRDTYSKLGEAADLLVMTYYDSVDFLDQICDLPIKGLGLDLVHGSDNLAALRHFSFPSHKILILGVVDGINIWKTELKQAARQVQELQSLTKAEIWLSNAAPLYHLPVSAALETQLEPALQERIAFADERLAELRMLKTLLTKGETKEIRTWNTYKHSTESWFDAGVRRRVKNLQAKDFSRELPYEKRDSIQRRQLEQPLFPTTTIGSFPQTDDVRKMRQAYRSGQVSDEAYWTFIQDKIRQLIKVQEEVGLDIFVHGEFERTDMVEFFAEKLEGIATVSNGWVLSYGTRVYRRPIIYGDIRRPSSMTVREIAFAQSLTDKPVKGMLTGPVTILAWSFARQDIPAYEVAYQLGLALYDEVKELEADGVKIIQIDEPAFRELAPMKPKRWAEYFDWAAKAYRLASKALPETQIHTHACYSDFNEIIGYIAALDADVTTIAAARSGGEVIEALERFQFPSQIGPGVYDVHSPVIPSVEAILTIIKRVTQTLPKENIWINPDCGLKTRRWEEVIPALRNMVQVAKELRQR